MILREEYKNKFWIGTVLLGNVLPMILLLTTGNLILLSLAGVLVLVGMYVTEKIWIEGPQRIPLA